MLAGGRAKEGRSGMGGSTEGQSVHGEGGDALADRIAAALPQLSKKHQGIAVFVLEQPDLVAFAPASEVGVRTETSAATVVRFCQVLGYDGYQQLQEAIRARLSSQRVAMQRLEEQLAGPANGQDLLTRVFAMDIYNIERTAIGASGDRLEGAAAAIRAGRQVLVVGSALAAMLVECLAYSLQVMDIPTRSVTGGEEPLALALAFLQPEDVVIGISFRREPRYTLAAIERAKEVGAATIGIANSELSPLLHKADYPFWVVTEGFGLSPSAVAAVALLDALVAAVQLGDPEQVARLRHQLDTTYKQSRLLDE
jgi:DNA-binding MurR/RpiR family transcriptional regulator